jgi:hypothetical protein
MTFIPIVEEKKERIAKKKRKKKSPVATFPFLCKKPFLPSLTLPIHSFKTYPMSSTFYLRAASLVGKVPDNNNKKKKKKKKGVDMTTK